MKNIIYIRTAAVVAVLIGFMPVIAGYKVLSGAFVPDYNVLTWLVNYNVIMGIVSIVTGLALWITHRFAFKLTSFVAIAHISVLALLLTVFSNIVADHSIKAMVFRSVIWVMLYIIVWKKSAPGSSKT